MESASIKDRKSQMGTPRGNHSNGLSPRDSAALHRQGSLRIPRVPRRRSSSGMEMVQRSLSFKENSEKLPNELKNSLNLRIRTSSQSSDSREANGKAGRSSQASCPSGVTSTWSSGFCSPRKSTKGTRRQINADGRLEMSLLCSLQSLDSTISHSRSKLVSNEREMSQLRIEKQHFDILIRVVNEWIGLIKAVNRLSKAVPEMSSVRKTCAEIHSQLQTKKSLFNSNLEPILHASMSNTEALKQDIERLKKDLKHCVQNGDSVTAKHVEDIRYDIGYLKGTLTATRDIFF